MGVEGVRAASAAARAKLTNLAASVRVSDRCENSRVDARSTAQSRLPVLSHVGRAEDLGVPGDLAAGIEWIFLPAGRPLPDGVHGEVLITVPRYSPHLAATLARGVRWVHVLGTGIDAFPFDVVASDVVVTNSRGGSAVPISEWVLAAMLAAEKNLPAEWLRGPPNHWSFRPEIGTLDGRRLALVGLGAIGCRVARLAQAFGMEVLALRARPEPSPVPGVELATSLDELLPGAHHVVLAAPLTPATRHLIDERALGLMTPGAHLVNVARGGLVDHDALRVALDDGIVGLATLDAVEPEPVPAGHWLYEHPRVRLSAHVSWNAPGAISELAEAFWRNLRRWMAGEDLDNVIDRDRGY